MTNGIILNDEKDGARQPMMATAPRLFAGAALGACYAVEHCFCGFRHKSPVMLKSCLKSSMAQGLFRAYCVTRARRFRIRSAACLRVIRLRQSGQYLTLFEVDANAAPHSAHRRLSSAW